jgi:hypothetical protein
MHIVVVEALLIAIYLGNELILIDIRKPFRPSTCLVRYSWSIPALSLRVVTETRPTRNKCDTGDHKIKLIVDDLANLGN